MNEHQAAALKQHCRFAFETTNPKLTWLTKDGRICLTVASGNE